MSTLRRLSCSFAAVLLAGCAGTTPGRAPAAASAPAPTPSADARRQLLAALERELEPLEPRRFTAPADRFSGRTEAAKVVTFEEGEEFTTVTIPVGTESPITCFVYRDSIDPGVSLQRIAGALAEEVTLEALRPVEIAAAGERPVVFLELDYTHALADGRIAAGQVKLMAAPDDDLPLICLHDELGYRRSFRRITQSLAASLTPRGRAPRFSEISVFRINERPVGYEQRRIWDAEQGQTVIEKTAVLVMPRSPKELVFQDTSSTQISDARQRITRFSYARARDGELLVHALLERQQGNKYSVKGTHEGREVTAVLTTRDPAGLPSQVAIERALKAELLGGRAQELAFETWAPEELPEALRLITYRKTDASARSVAVVNGERTAHGELDAHGAVERVRLPVGADATMILERAAAKGTP